MQKDSLESSMQRSKEAYVRIKMARRAEGGKHLRIAAEHKVSVERIHLVIQVLEGMERAKTLLQPMSTYEESQEAYLELAGILEVLKRFESSSVIAELVKKIERRLGKIERLLDKTTKTRIVQSLETGDALWGKYLVNPKAKIMLFVNTVQEHIEKKLMPQFFKAAFSFPEPFAARAERLAGEVFSSSETRAVSEVVRGLLSKEIRKAVGSACYANLKSLESAHSRVIGVVRTCEYLHKNYTPLTDVHNVDSALMEMVRNACKTLFVEAESSFTASQINEKTLQDPLLDSMIEIVQEIDKTPAVFAKWGSKRPVFLKRLAAASQERAGRLKGKLKGLIAQDNAVHALKKTGAPDLPSSKHLLEEISAEMKRALVKDVESSQKEENKTASLLRHVETVAAFTKNFYVSPSHKKTIISEYKENVKALGRRLNSLDDISERHLTATIENMFRRDK
ncbi:hypothetical protein NECID01_0015 [Nematocida sp. AWRm77]|nr:hypothetical protein NECID01_0015 [Nematocida sp. AWRm77]